MAQKRRTFQRPLGERRYRKLFVIAVEGVKTERQYFGLFNDRQAVVRVTCLKGDHGSAPLQVLKRMEDHLRREALKPTDEAWLVVDKDGWTDHQLEQLYDWSQKKDNYGFALSNPMFEYWLLLHFEDGYDITSSRECRERLNRHIPGYDKAVDPHRFSRDKIADAIRRARQRDNPPCIDWPRVSGDRLSVG